MNAWMQVTQRMRAMVADVGWGSLKAKQLGVRAGRDVRRHVQIAFAPEWGVTR
jgi:hypothetical protein